MKKVKVTKRQLNNYVQKLIKENRVVISTRKTGSGIIEVYDPTLLNDFIKSLRNGIETGSTGFGQQFEQICSIIASQIGIGNPVDLNTQDGGNFEFADVAGTGTDSDVKAVLYSCKCSSKANIETMDAKISTLEKGVESYALNYNLGPYEYVQPGLITGYPSPFSTRSYNYLGIGMVVNVFKPTTNAPKLRVDGAIHSGMQFGQPLNTANYYGDTTKITNRDTFAQIVFRGANYNELLKGIKAIIYSHFAALPTGKGSGPDKVDYKNNYFPSSPSGASGLSNAFEKQQFYKAFLGQKPRQKLMIQAGDKANANIMASYSLSPLGPKIKEYLEAALGGQSAKTDQIYNEMVTGMFNFSNLVQSGPGETFSKPRSYNVIILGLDPTEKINNVYDITNYARDRAGIRQLVAGIVKQSIQKSAATKDEVPGFVDASEEAALDSISRTFRAGGGQISNPADIQRLSGPELRNYHNRAQAVFERAALAIVRNIKNSEPFQKLLPAEQTLFIDKVNELSSAMAIAAEYGDIVVLFQKINEALSVLPEAKRMDFFKAFGQLDEVVTDIIQRGVGRTRDTLSSGKELIEKVKKFIDFGMNLFNSSLSMFEQGVTFSRIIDIIDMVIGIVREETEADAQEAQLYESILQDLMETSAKKQRAANKPKKIKITKRQLQLLLCRKK